MSAPREGTTQLVSSAVGAVIILLSGFAAIALAWAGAAASIRADEQLAFSISGALGGVSMCGLGAKVLTIQHRRRTEAGCHAELDVVIRAAEALVAARRRAEERP